MSPTDNAKCKMCIHQTIGFTYFACGTLENSKHNVHIRTVHTVFENQMRRDSEIAVDCAQGIGLLFDLIMHSLDSDDHRHAS